LLYSVLAAIIIIVRVVVVIVACTIEKTIKIFPGKRSLFFLHKRASATKRGGEGENNMDDLKLKTPFTMTVSGGTGSGKSFWLKSLLENQSHCVDKPFGRVMYCYGIYQPLFDTLRESVPDIEFFEGLPKDEFENYDKFGADVNALVVLDDLMSELANDSELTNLFCRFSHHAHVSCAFVLQNFFHEGREIRNVTRNSHYLVFTKSPRATSVVQTLSRQLYPGRKDFLTDAYAKATKKPFGYLFLDLHPASDEKLRVREGLLPDEQPYCYLPK
jgi:hypothetical protein